MAQPGLPPQGTPKPPPIQGRPGFQEELLYADPLLDCLVEVTRIHGRPSTRAALIAGLPIDKGAGLTPSLFARAATRAGLSSKVVKMELDDIDPVLLPAILLLKNNDACVFLGWDESRKNARILFPEAGQGVAVLSRKELQRRYIDICIFARPHFRFDQRSPEVTKLPQRHWFWGAILEQAKLYRDVLLGAAVINFLALAMPLFSMNVYDRVVPNKAFDTLWVLSLGVALAVVIDFLLRTLRGYFVDLAASRIDLRLSTIIMERVLGLRMEARPQSVGTFASNLRSFETVRDFIASATVTAFIDLPFSVIFLLVMFILAWPLILPTVCAMAVMAFYAYVVQYKMQELSESTHRAGGLRNAILVESLTALETIKTQGAEGNMQSRWEKSVAYTAAVNRKMRLMSASATNGVMEMQQVANVAVIIIGVYLIGTGDISQGALIASSTLSSRAIAPLGQMVGLMLQYQGAKSSLAALNTIMEKPVERPEDANFIHRPELKGEIEFKDVEFSYPGTKVPALKGVSFKIKPGEKVVVIGRVGSGKTTLQKLLLGLYLPTAGSVTIDGVDMRQLDPADVRRNVGYVAQDVVLFYGSLRDNISIGAPFADDNAIMASAEVAGLSDFVNRHPQGFDMLIGERGESLSGGQRQGVAIARAFLMDPPILMLDEPTSAMDYSSEHMFKQRLKTFGAHKTVIVVTHRNSLLEVADRIIVIDEGRVVADGPRAQVLEALQSGRVGRGG